MRLPAANAAPRADRRPAVLALAVLAALTLALVACRGGGNNTKAARNLTDPRRVPTATIPAQRGTPLAALQIGQTSPNALPETYVVKAGDTLGSIAQGLGISADDLARANPTIDPRGLRIGQELKVPRPSPSPTASSGARGPATPTRPAGSPAATATPTPAPGRSPTPAPSAGPSATPARTAAPSTAPGGAAQTYTVQSGDTGCAIARRFGVSLSALAQANNTTIDGIASLRIGQELRIPASTGESPGC